MNEINPELLSELYGKDLIAYGTGGTGNVVIPYLAQHKKIRLHGVTNSRIIGAANGTFPHTDLPMRSIQAWSELMPEATILVTVIDPTAQKEILDICRDKGFQEILFVPFELIYAIAYANLDIYAIPQKDGTTSWLRPEGNPWLSLMCFANQVHETHQKTFSEFRGCHRGETVAVVGTGPSLAYYSPVAEARHIGVNTAYRKENIKLDYYFLGHYIPGLCKELVKYDFIKFFTDYDVFPEYIVEENGARRYFINFPSKEIHADIVHYPLMGSGSIIFSAIQFALYTRPKRLLLIGCDCSANGHFDEANFSEINMSYNMYSAVSIWIDGYKRLKKFVKQHYPDTEIVSVNPVGLKGMFRDVYTKSYLDAHSEIDRAECEILSISKLKNIE